jgi:hypothetical protein
MGGAVLASGLCFSGDPLRQLLQRESGDWGAERIHCGKVGRHPHYNLRWRLQVGRRQVLNNITTPTFIYPFASPFKFAVMLM